MTSDPNIPFYYALLIIALYGLTNALVKFRSNQYQDVLWDITKNRPRIAHRDSNGTWCDISGVPLADQERYRPLTVKERIIWKRQGNYFITNTHS